MRSKNPNFFKIQIQIPHFPYQLPDKDAELNPNGQRATYQSEPFPNAAIFLHNTVLLELNLNGQQPIAEYGRKKPNTLPSPIVGRGGGEKAIKPKKQENENRKKRPAKSQEMPTQELGPFYLPVRSRMGMEGSELPRTGTLPFMAFQCSSFLPCAFPSA